MRIPVRAMRIALVAAAVGVPVGVARSQRADSARTAAARALLDQRNTSQLFAAIVLNHVAEQAAANPSLPPEFWRTVVPTLMPANPDSILAPVYTNLLATSDLEAVVAFTESPVGQRFAREFPKVWADIKVQIQAGLAPPSSSPPPAPPNPDVATARAIRRHLDVMGFRRLMEQSSDSTERAATNGASKQEAAFQRAMMHEFIKAIVDSVIVPVYAQHLTPDEVRQVNAFFDSPAGRHLLAALPTIDKRMNAALQNWTAAMDQRLVKMVRERLATNGD